MEFPEKLQELRKQKGLTQEELAARLYVSRTAVSKWESGRGYPNIESLKAIARVFSVTVDELLSADELLTVAEADTKEKEKNFCNLFFGLLDLCAVLLLFLPFFSAEAEGEFFGVSLLALAGVQPYLKAAYLSAVCLLSASGILTLALQNFALPAWHTYKTGISLALGAAALLLFIVSRQPYAAVFAFALLAGKVAALLQK